MEGEIDLLESYHAAGLRVVQLCYNRRNVSDELIRVFAATGGVVGSAGFPAFLTARLLFSVPSVPAWLQDEVGFPRLDRLNPRPAAPGRWRRPSRS